MVKNKNMLSSMTLGKASGVNWITRQGSLVVFVGENGAGKSRLLNMVAKESHRKGIDTIAISNTPFSNFPYLSRGASRLLTKSGAAAPESILKLAISNGEIKDELSLRKISRVLQYCRYRQDVGVKLSVHRGRRQGISALSVLDNMSQEDRSEVLSLGELLLGRGVSGRVLWYDFDRLNPDYSHRAMIPRIIRWESVLRRIGVLASIKLYLERDGRVLPLSRASSGELSLISSMAFIATSISDGCTIAVDEPENSLHPKWQREYIGLLLELTKYRNINVLIATHSPLIVSEMELDRSWREEVKVVLLSDTPKDVPSEAPGSLEGIMTEVFGTITPENNYLSRRIVGLLSDLENSRASLELVLQVMDDLSNAGADDRQRSALDAAKEIARRISESS